MINNRDSVASRSSDSIFSLLSHSENPSGVTYGGSRRLVAYAHDLPIDDKGPPDEEDVLHDPEGKGMPNSALPWRGFLNAGVLLVLVTCLLCLFIFYPVITFIGDNASHSYRGQYPRQRSSCIVSPSFILFLAFTDTFFRLQKPEIIDVGTTQTRPAPASTGAPSIRMRVDLWYGATNDQEWYNPGLMTTEVGKLSILLEEVANH